MPVIPSAIFAQDHYLPNALNAVKVMDYLLILVICARLGLSGQTEQPIAHHATQNVQLVQAHQVTVCHVFLATIYMVVPVNVVLPLTKIN